MNATFYVGWYLSATVLAALVWVLTRRVHNRWLKRAARSGILAFGFTTLPLMSPDGGLLVPIAVYYLSFNHWLEAAGLATLVIGVVWVVLFGLASLIGEVWRFLAART